MITIIEKNDKQLGLKEMQSIVGGLIQVHPEKVKINNKR